MQSLNREKHVEVVPRHELPLKTGHPRHNDPTKDLVEYRGRVQLFGNTSSLALAITGLPYAVNNEDVQTSDEVKKFVEDNHVDNALQSTDSPEQAIQLLTEARAALQRYHIRLHKLCSNSNLPRCVSKIRTCHDDLPEEATIDTKVLLASHDKPLNIGLAIIAQRTSNFTKAINVYAINQDNEKSRTDLDEELKELDVQWIFNPPKASHFSGVFERTIGSVKRINHACMLRLGPRHLTRDELHTFFTEATDINNTPLTQLSTDPNVPFPLIPAKLLINRDYQCPEPRHEFTEADLGSYGARHWRRV
ncbi:hypothetical protein HAZT_HAZT011614 [Hyalella azteca]|uniref:Uncharacterized protein n=1 Tax=Hyalella azteca TaxID=294128 RepID=A0A6A0HAL7_HYAAZ|nr:hypothetical protein HAZT_HAZT011614 [Hyalella azteca]